ncbi:NAD-dependent epimerase/dehydratase family protein [Bacillus salipaludis]|nr:NAD-dependent epimerase/dehydratase family protein [Bacillus salipaludis]
MILVVGGAGYIGIHLVKELVKKEEVIVLANLLSTPVYFSPFITVKKSPISAFNLKSVERLPVVFLLIYTIVL